MLDIYYKIICDNVSMVLILQMNVHRWAKYISHAHCLFSKTNM